MSELTIRYTAESSIVPWILVSNPPDFERLCRTYRDVAAEHGRTLGLGESVGAFRAVHFGKTEAEAVELLQQHQLCRAFAIGDERDLARPDVVEDQGPRRCAA